MDKKEAFRIRVPLGRHLQRRSSLPAVSIELRSQSRECGFRFATSPSLVEPTPGAARDQAMSTLLSDLHAKGLLDQTLMVLATDFGPTPRINDKDGRDRYN